MNVDKGENLVRSLPVDVSDWIALPFILTPLAVAIDRYRGLNYLNTTLLLHDQIDFGHKLFLVASEKPHWHQNDWSYCFAEVDGNGNDTGNWYWYTLNQVICVSA